MDLSVPGSTNSPLSTSLTPVFGDNVQDLLGTGALQVNPSAIITVNSIADTVDDNDGVTTLREAINQANADDSQDLIVFDRSLFSSQQTITLSGTELDITHNLDIIAPRDPLTGGDLVTVSGNNASRVFEIETGATVSIDGLIITDGSARRDDGGGIKNSGTLNVSNSTISNNSASYYSYVNANGGNGGGIYNSGTMTVSASTISGNNAESFPYNYGAGIYNSGTMTVSTSTISGNKGRGVAGFSDGGGIYNSNSGILTVSTSTINSNLANGARGGSGGGISNDGNLVVSNSTISDNSGNRYGNNIHNSGNLTLLFSTLTLSSAAYGGGVFNDGSVNVRNTIIDDVVSNSSFFDNGTFIGTFVGAFTSEGYNLMFALVI